MTPKEGAATWIIESDRTERGATAVEYGLLVALIAGVIIAVVVLIGPQLLPGMQTVTSTCCPRSPTRDARPIRCVAVGWLPNQN